MPSNTVSFNIRVSDDGSIRKVQVDASELQSALNGVGSASVGASNGASRLGSSLGGMIARYASWTAALTLGVKTIKQTIATNAQFERSNSELASVLGTTLEGVSGLTTAAKDLGRTTEFTASEVTALQTSLARLGFTEQQILAMQDPVLKFASAVGTDLASAADFSGSALRAFGLAAGDTKHLLDVMAASTSKSALDFSKLQTSISIIGPVAHSFGLSVEDTVTMLGLLSNAGFDASSASTALRNIILNLADSNGKLAKGLGHTARNFPEIVSALKECTEKGIDLNSALEMTDKRSVSAFSALINGAGSADELREALGKCDGSLETMYHTMTDNLAGATNGLKSAWEGLMLEFQNSNGPLAELERKLTNLLNAITDAKKAANDKRDAGTFSAQDAARNYINRLWGQTGGDIDAIKADIEASNERLLQGSGYKPSGMSKKKEAKEQTRLIQLWHQELQMINAAEAALQERIAWEAKWKADMEAANEESATDGIDDTEPLTEEQQRAIEKYNNAINDYRLSIERAVEVNSLFGDGQSDLAVKLKAMESGLTSLIAKYGSNRKEVKSLIAEYISLKKAGEALPALDPSALTTTAKTSSALNTGKSDDIKDYAAAIGNAVKMNRIFGDGQSDAAASLAAMESLLPSLIDKYGLEDIAIQKLINDYQRLKDASDLGEKSTDSMENAQNAISSLSMAFEGLNGIMSESAGSWMSWIGNMLRAVAQAIPAINTLTAAHKKKTTAAVGDAVAEGTAAVAGIPVVGPALAVAAAASVAASIISVISSLPKFANGGIAYGPTLGIFGEYPGAANNPEVVAPLDKLTDIVGGRFTLPSAIEVRARGRDLYGIIELEKSIRRRG